MTGEPSPRVQLDDKQTTASVPDPTDSEMDTYRYFSLEFEKQIKAQTTNVLIAASFCVGVLIIGLIGTGLLYRNGGIAGSALEYMKLGPVALSSISLPFPLRAYLQYRVRMPIYKGYKRLFDEAIANRRRIEPYLIEDARAALKSLHKMD